MESNKVHLRHCFLTLIKKLLRQLRNWFMRPRKKNIVSVAAYEKWFKRFTHNNIWD